MSRGLKALAAAGVAGGLLLLAHGPLAAQEIKIGVVLSQTGTFSFVGVPATNAIKLAVDDLNAEHFFGNEKLTMLYEDNQSNTPQAISLITQLVTNDDVLAIIGPVSTGEAMAAGPVAVSLKVPMYTTATDPGVLKAGPWVFKEPENAETFMTAVAKVIVDKVKPKSCYLVHIRDNDGYIRQSNIFRDAIKAGGINIAADDSILAADTDFTALATKIVSSGADCLFMSTPPEQGANIVLQARQAGMPASTVLVGNTGMSADQYVKTGGKAVDGTIFPAEFDPSGVNDLSRKFIADYTKLYGSPPEAFAADGYTMMLVLANAIKNAGPNPTREAVRDALAKTKDVTGVIGQGTYSFDADRTPVYGVAVLQLKDGKWVKP